MRSLLILFAYASFASMQSVFRQFEWYRELYRQFPLYVPETIKVGVGLAVCIAAAMWMYGRGDHFAMRGKFIRGIGFGLIASSPMLVGLALTRSVRVDDTVALLFLAALFPLAEEIVSRGCIAVAVGITFRMTTSLNSRTYRGTQRAEPTAGMQLAMIH
jgi:hypothetical protein